MASKRFVVTGSGAARAYSIRPAVPEGRIDDPPLLEYAKCGFKLLDSAPNIEELGFYPVATHEIGELQSQSRRITLVLDLKACYRRLSVRRNWLFCCMTGHWADALHRRLAA
jgi:hypothetical protein